MICDNENCLKVFVAERYSEILWSKGVCTEQQQPEESPPWSPDTAVVVDDSSGTDEMMKLVNLQRLAADLQVDGVWIN